MNPADPMTWINLGGMGLFALVVYLELRGLRKDLREEIGAMREQFTQFVERLVLVEERTRDTTPVEGVPIVREGRYGHHRRRREDTPKPDR